MSVAWSHFMITLSYKAKVSSDITTLPCQFVTQYEEVSKQSTQSITGDSGRSRLATVYNVCPAQVSPLPISVLRWTGVRGLWPGRGKVARVLLHLRLSLCSLPHSSLTALCSRLGFPGFSCALSRWAAGPAADLAAGVGHRTSGI